MIFEILLFVIFDSHTYLRNNKTVGFVKILLKLKFANFISKALLLQQKDMKP